MSGIIVRQATVADVEEAAALFDEYRVWYGQASDLEGARRFLLDRFERSESVLYVAVDKAENQYVGFTQLYPSFSSISMKRTWVLNDLFVRKEHRQRGAASLLLQTAKEHAERTRAKGLELSTALDNVRAQRLYESKGYKRDEEFYHYFLSL
ncbi:GNAT family N-acetyltransferase [Cohnella sp. AR92]|uniref:GNAT family N-acetyltransferase n=1 Tax=Cohnella sp. AR92 TaxID=648716 RepID=UPI000F8D5724|nr:GNAT family N-acetyltransferase [Cohnella sp. AR92]RUS47956.1 GNAT family N-acetyltransferase [Cohnella sp. AR92]